MGYSRTSKKANSTLFRCRERASPCFFRESYCVLTLRTLWIAHRLPVLRRRPFSFSARFAGLAPLSASSVLRLRLLRDFVVVLCSPDAGPTMLTKAKTTACSCYACVDTIVDVVPAQHWFCTKNSIVHFRVYDVLNLNDFQLIVIVASM
jgi:hypothetical protein